MRLDRLTGRQLDDFYRRLQQRGLSNSSVHQHHSIVHAALGRAVKWGILKTNPADRASPPTLKRTTVGAPAVADVQRLIAAAESSDPVLASAIAVGAVTGARRGELCALRWSDVDWPRRKLTIARSLTVIDKKVTEGQTKTHQRRDIAMDAALEAFLTRRRAEQESYAEAVGAALVADPYILTAFGRRVRPMPAGRPLGWVPTIGPGARVDYPFSRASSLRRHRSHCRRLGRPDCGRPSRARRPGPNTAGVRPCLRGSGQGARRQAGQRRLRRREQQSEA